MFWAIYNETNQNQTHDRPDITNDPSDPDFIYMDDHRYLMAREMFDNIPLYDISLGVDHMQRWGGSIGNPFYHLWRFQGAVNPQDLSDPEEPGEEDCIHNGSLIGYYKDKTSDSDILNWFNGYADCFRFDIDPDGALAGNIGSFDSAYDEIIGQIGRALDDHLSGSPNPISGAGYIKTTSKCYVFNVVNGLRQGCYTPANMNDYCSQTPVGENPPTTRNCQVSSQHNPSNTDIAIWLASSDALDAPQQLNLATIVTASYSITLGLYTPDSPPELLDQRFFFLISEIVTLNGISGETTQDAWSRHRQRFEDFPGYVPGFGVTGYSHVLRSETSAETWITFVYQSEG